MVKTLVARHGEETDHGSWWRDWSQAAPIEISCNCCIQTSAGCVWKNDSHSVAYTLNFPSLLQWCKIERLWHYKPALSQSYCPQFTAGLQTKGKHHRHPAWLIWFPSPLSRDIRAGWDHLHLHPHLTSTKTALRWQTSPCLFDSRSSGDVKGAILFHLSHEDGGDGDDDGDDDGGGDGDDDDGDDD